MQRFLRNLSLRTDDGWMTDDCAITVALLTKSSRAKNQKAIEIHLYYKKKMRSHSSGSQLHWDLSFALCDCQTVESLPKREVHTLGVQVKVKAGSQHPDRSVAFSPWPQQGDYNLSANGAKHVSNTNNPEQTAWRRRTWEVVAPLRGPVP